MRAIISPNLVPLPEEIQGVVTPLDERIIHWNLEPYRELGHRVFQLDKKLLDEGHNSGDVVLINYEDRPTFGEISWSFIVGEPGVALPRITRTEIPDGPRLPIYSSTLFFVDNYRYLSAYQAWSVKYQPTLEGLRVISQKPIARRVSKQLVRLLDLNLDQLPV